MKKILTLLIVALVAVNTAQARKLISFGPKVGMNLNYASGSNNLKPGEIGYNFGLFLEIRPIKFLSISADVMYSKEGVKFDPQYEGIKTSLNFDMGYLNIPILANVYLWKGLNIKAGIQPSIKLHGRVSLDGSSATDLPDDFSKSIKNGAFSIPVGIGYNFSWGLMIDLRYNISVTKNIEPFNENAFNGHFSSRVVTLGIGWSF